MGDFLNKLTKKFIVSEGNPLSPTIFSYIQSLGESLSNMNPKTQSESRRLSIAREHLREIRRKARHLQERVQVLEEQVRVLEESKEGRN
tara:strand:- start:2240 stop:2506 length:267 start_codon:yes stop_codon:yes gene_type:complete